MSKGITLLATRLVHSHLHCCCLPLSAVMSIAALDNAEARRDNCQRSIDRLTEALPDKSKGPLNASRTSQVRCLCVLVYLCTCVLVYLCTCVLVYLCTCVLVYLCTCVLVYLCTCAFMGVLVYLCVYACTMDRLKRICAICWMELII
jgi:Flp pilus assembly protein TadB